MIRSALLGLLVLLSGSVAQAAIVTVTYTDAFVAPANELIVQYDDADLASGFTSITLNSNPITVPEFSNSIATPDTTLGPSILDSTFIGLGFTDILTIVDGEVDQATGAFAGLTGQLTVQSIPEPSTMAGIMLLSLAGLGRRRRRHQLA